MILSDYYILIELMHSCNSRDGLRHIAEMYPKYSIKTLGSIYSQDYQRKMKKTHHKHYNPDKMEEYYERYLSSDSDDFLLILADEVDLSPALLARIVLERFLAHTEYNNETVPKSRISSLLKEPTQISDPKLTQQIYMCITADDIYGPIVDTIKHSIGHEYECLLKRNLEERGLAYLDEHDLRAKGYDKTPDVKLEVPIAVDGQVVNWIESKASFGDEESHQGYLKEQFWSYWNRFGPGLVIYWFGFIDELDVNREKGIMLKDHFPEQLITMMNKE